VYEAKQNPGEIVYIPSGVIHGIHNTGDFSCGVTANYMDRWGMHSSLFYHLVEAPRPAIMHPLYHGLKKAAPEPITVAPEPRETRPSVVAGENRLVTDMLRAWLDWGLAGRELNVTEAVGFGVYRSGDM
jgi:hypothetical protein